MLGIEDILEGCFVELSKEYFIEHVNHIPDGNKLRKTDIVVWRIILVAKVFGKIAEVEVFIAFPREFPYNMPWVIIPEERFAFLPHISYKTRKLCLYEDDVVYDTSNIYGLIKDCIVRTRRWLELYSNQDNTAEYVQEISSYWDEEYDGEKEIEPHWILLGSVPDKSCELQGYVYPVDFLGKDDKYFEQGIVCGRGTTDQMVNNIKTRYRAKKISVLFLKSLSVQDRPPYSMTGGQFVESIKDTEDKTICQTFLKQHPGGFVFFQIGTNYILGGLSLPKISLQRDGFRPGKLTALDILTKFEYKSKKLGRIKVRLYEENRIAERTAGSLMPRQNFLIVGLGSIGSNLCYFLNGYNNASFSLVDSDNLVIDNIGRHLLGFSYIDQRKVSAVSEYLQQYRPDRQVTSIYKQLETLPVEEINTASAIFVCTGDLMSERWVLDKMLNDEIIKPVFFLWVEPYGISGIMIYVNPADNESIKKLRMAAGDCFMDYCLIDRMEYKDGGKLIQRDAGCNGKYALYSANDVTLFLSAMFPIIDRLLIKSEETQVFQWVGNVDIPKQREIQLVERVGTYSKGQLVSLNP